MVELSGVTPLRGVQTSPRALSKSSAPQDASSGELGDKSLSQLVSLAAELADAPPPVDVAKIAEVRMAISRGTYEIDPHRIAQALLGNDQ